MYVSLIWLEQTGEVVFQRWNDGRVVMERRFSGAQAACDWAEIVKWESFELLGGSDPFENEEELWKKIKDADAILKFLAQPVEKKVDI